MQVNCGKVKVDVLQLNFYLFWKIICSYYLLDEILLKYISCNAVYKLKSFSIKDF